MTRYDPRWPEMARDGPRWPEMARDGPDDHPLGQALLCTALGLDATAWRRHRLARCTAERARCTAKSRERGAVSGCPPPPPLYARVAAVSRLDEGCSRKPDPADSPSGTPFQTVAWQRSIGRRMRRGRRAGGGGCQRKAAGRAGPPPGLYTCHGPACG